GYGFIMGCLSFVLVSHISINVGISHIRPRCSLRFIIIDCCGTGVTAAFAALTTIATATTTITGRFRSAVAAAGFCFGSRFGSSQCAVFFRFQVNVQLITNRTIAAAFTTRRARCITGVVGDVVTLLTLGAGRTFAAVAAAFTVAVAAVVAAIITFTATFSAGFSTALGVAFAAFTTVTAVTVAAIAITAVAVAVTTITVAFAIDTATARAFGTGRALVFGFSRLFFNGRFAVKE